MPIQATVILDSGCFLPGNPDNLSTEIGYFQSSRSAQDIRVIADGKEKKFDELKTLGKKCQLEIRHVKKDGSIYDKGAHATATFHDELLHLRDLYGEDVPFDQTRFDCVLRFDSGYFCGALLKPRHFKLHRQQSDGKYIYSSDDKPKLISRPIAHNVYVYFKLKKGETIQLARGGEVFWSSDQSGAKDRLEIEIIADNTTAEKFYRQALQGKRDCYWLPNQGDPPPACSVPPCRPPSGG
jgi:hypothetical protein